MNSASRTDTRRLAVLVAAVCVLASAAYGGAPTALTNGAALTGLSGATGSETYYRIDVPAGAGTLSIATTGGTGDVDLYVKLGAQPTTTNYDYRPYKVGNEETVDVNKPAAGTWYITLRGYAAYANVTLTATYTMPQPAIKALTNSVPVTGLAAAAKAELYYSIDVPAGTTKLEIAISAPPGTGDADLYVKKGSLPTASVYDYRPYLSGSNETISVDNPDAATWYIMIKGYSDYSGVTLLASFAGGSGSGTVLQNGVPVTGLSGVANSKKLYRFDLPAGQKSMTIKMSGGTGDADLYVKLKSPPTMTDYDYRPFLSGNEETVTIDSPAAGTWYVLVRGYADYSGVSLTATWGSFTALQNGVPVPNPSGALNSEIVFSLDVPAGQSRLTVATSGGTGNADLYVRAGAVPTTTVFDYGSTGTGNSETITVTSPGTGTWYILLKGTKAYDGLSLTATLSDVTVLQNNVAVTDLSGALGSETFFSIAVPTGQTNIEFIASGGTGNADLYIKQGAKPTTSQWDYRLNTSGNNESININSDMLAGTWYIMLKGATAYNGVSLTAHYSTAEAIVTPLTNGVPVPNLSGMTGTQLFYRIDVPAGQSKFEISISGGTGDADLYVRQGSKPSAAVYDYKPDLAGNDEDVTINNPAAGTWYILVRGHQAFSGVTLLASYGTAGTATTLRNGVAVTGIAGTAGSEQFYKINVPAGRPKLDVVMTGTMGDADLYVKIGVKPTATDYTYRPYLSGSNESVSIDNPDGGTWYIMIKGYTDYSGVTLTATYTPPPETILVLTNGVAVPGIAGDAGSDQFYKIDVPMGQSLLTIETSGGTGDVDLYVKKGDKPSLSSYDYRPYLVGNNEKVDVTSPAAATWYVLLHGYQAYAGVTLKATYSGTAPAAGSLQFKSASYSVAENGGSVRLYVSRTGGSSGAASVHYATANGTATAGSDYTTTSGTLSWPDGDATDKYFDVVITNDSIYEGDETFTVSLSGASGAGLGSPSLTTVTILDDETAPAGSLQFKSATYSVAENGGSVRIYVSRAGGSFGAASVNYATANGTAPAGSKYTAKSGTLTWSNGDGADKYFDVVIINNSTYEGDETFTVSLSGASGAGLGVPSQTTVTILDDETPPSGSVQFKSATYSVAENGGSVRIYVSRTGGSFGAASVNYATANGTAPAGSKYTAKSGTLTWSNGDSADKYFDVVVINNSTYEGDETFTVSLSGASGASLGSPSQTTVTILDDETPPSGSVQFKSATYSVAENGGSVRIYVSRTGGSFGAASVNYATANGTAMAGSDYTAKSGTLSWLNGDAADKYFDVAITNDSIYEGDETFTVSLSGASGASLGLPSLTTVTILDDETPPAGSLQFKSATYSVAENGGSVRVYVSRTGGSFGAASVNYATTNGTATAGSDYTAKSGTLTWLNGDAADKYFDVSITNDSIYEGNETFAVSLSGAILGLPSQTTVTILDDETPPAGNIFNTDPNCVAVWRFESTNLTADSVGTNTLQNHGVTANATDKEEGTSSADFVASEKDYFWIADANQSAKFPFKNATAPKTISLAFWMKLDALPLAPLTWDPFSKVDEAHAVNCFTTMVDGHGNFGFYIGTNNGTWYEDAWVSGIAVGKWYHVVVTYRDSDKSYRINVWDAQAAIVLVDRTGTTQNNISITNTDVYLGSRQGIPDNRYLDGRLDEMAVFNDVLTLADIAKIRAGTYGR